MLRHRFRLCALFAVSALVSACSDGSKGGGSGGSAGQAGGSTAGGAAAGGAGDESGGAGGSGSPSCPSTSEPIGLGLLAVAGLSEASGIAASRANPGVLYTHNDSGHAAEVFAVTEDGAHVATLAFTGALAHDWEDIAIGPGPVNGTNYLYVADIGDDPEAPWRETSIVERALEPELATTDRERGVTLDFDSLYLAYPDGPHNAETLIAHPITGDLYVVTKEAERARFYLARSPLALDRINVLEYVTEVSFGSPGGAETGLATGGDLSENGQLLVVRTEPAAFLWRLTAGTDLATTLGEVPCSVPVGPEFQGEAIGFAADAASYFTLGEGESPQLFQVEFTP